MSDALNTAGKPEEALRTAEKAMRLDPAASDSHAYTLGDALIQMGRYEEGIPILKQHLAVYPDNLVAHLFMIIAESELGRGQDAQSEAAEVMRVSHTLRWLRCNLRT